MTGESCPTLHAQRADAFALGFRRSLGSRRFGSAELALQLGPVNEAKSGPRQPLLLRRGARSWMCGWVDLCRKRCELKSFVSLSEHRLPLRFEDYEMALDQIESFCQRWRIETRTRLASSVTARPTPSRLGPGLFGMVLGAAVARWLLGS